MQLIVNVPKKKEKNFQELLDNNEFEYVELETDTKKLLKRICKERNIKYTGELLWEDAESYISYMEFILKHDIRDDSLNRIEGELIKPLLSKHPDDMTEEEKAATYMTEEEEIEFRKMLKK